MLAGYLVALFSGSELVVDYRLKDGCLTGLWLIEVTDISNIKKSLQ
jgi:hypothetical protein